MSGLTWVQTMQRLSDDDKICHSQEKNLHMTFHICTCIIITRTSSITKTHLSRHMRFQTMWYVQGLRSACIYGQFDQSLCLSLENSMSVNLLTEHHLEFLSLKGGCTGSSESTFVKMPHCWKSQFTAHFFGFNMNSFIIFIIKQ